MTHDTDLDSYARLSGYGVHEFYLLFLVDREQPCGTFHGVEGEMGSQGKTDKFVWSGI